MAVIAADERPHEPGPELGWAEDWSFDFFAADGALGGWARLILLPNRRAAWYHAFLVGPGRQLVAVIDPEVPLPAGSLEIRTTGLWATHICETPLDHWTIGLEAFGLGVDDPEELYGRQLGERVPLGFDLEWEAEAPAAGRGGGYGQWCRVSGEILVGSEEIDFDGHGRRSHRWGLSALWDRRWFRIHGRLDDGTVVTAGVVDGDLGSATGTVDGQAVPVSAVSQTMSGPGMPTGAGVTIGGIEVGIDPVSVTPLELTDPEARRTRGPWALCRLAASDGRTGHGWAEWNEPQP